MLPQGQSSATKNTTKTPAKAALPAATPIAESTSSTAATPGSYWLQVVSLQNYADADRYKAKLILSGFNASVQRYTTNGRTYNRVMLGPFDSQKTAEQTQAQLKANNQLDSIVVKMR